jgi:hypothetical protein
MAATLTNKFFYSLSTKLVDFENDVFKIILMDTGFTFDRDTHQYYADVSAYELLTGNGYTQFDKTLSGVAVTEDNLNDRCSVTWNNPQWTASGGDIGPMAGAMILDDTVASDLVVGYIDFGGDQTQADGGVATIGNVEVRIGGST